MLGLAGIVVNSYLTGTGALQDTLKVSGAQVSPTEIESVLTAHPHKLVVDACVGGVSGGRTSDERVPRAWVVLSDEGRKRGVAQALQELETWARKNLSSYKWLRGGIEAIHEVWRATLTY